MIYISTYQLGQDGHKSSLTHESRLSTHVRAGEEDQTGAGVRATQLHVVWDCLLPEARVESVHDFQERLQIIQKTKIRVRAKEASHAVVYAKANKNSFLDEHMEKFVHG
jgi:hypothetical protein